MDSKEGTQTKPFLLDNESNLKPSRFEFLLLVDEIIYEYSLSILDCTIQSESLYRGDNDHQKSLLYNRELQNFEFFEEFNTSEFYQVAETTPDYRLFLSHASFFSLKGLQTIYDWFEHSLLIFTSKTKFTGTEMIMQADESQVKHISKMLFMLDKGVIGIKKVKLNSDFTKSLVHNDIRLKNKLQECGQICLDLNGCRIFLTNNLGEYEATKLLTKHRSNGQKTKEFEIGEEAEGTQRLIEILPALFELTQNSKLEVLVIDEFDLRLNSRLLKHVLKRYLELCNSKSRMQLIFTAQNLSLISDLPICNDEFCVTNLDIDNISRIISIGDYSDIKEDANILDLYHMGLFKGIPNILFENTKSNSFDVEYTS